MTAISPTKRRTLGSLNPNTSPCLSSKFDFDRQKMEDLQATGLSVLPSGCEKGHGEEEPARKRVCLDHHWGAQDHQHQHQHQHQPIEYGHGHRRNQSTGLTSPPIGSTTVLLNTSKSTANNVSQSTNRMMHETVKRPSVSVLPALHPNRVAAEGGTTWTVAGALHSALMANQISYPAGLVEQSFNNNHRPPKRTQNACPPRIAIANQVARQKAEIIRLRLSLATYKIRTGQTEVPLEQLEVRSLLPPWASEYHHHSHSPRRRRLASWVSGVSAETETDYNRMGNYKNNYHPDGSTSNPPASWSFVSSSTTNSQGQDRQGYTQRVNFNHLRLQHAAGAAIEAVQQAKQEQQQQGRKAWGKEAREERERYREWHGHQHQHRHHHNPHYYHHPQGSGSWEDCTTEQQDDHHDGFSFGDQSRQRRQQYSNGRKSLPDQNARSSWGAAGANTNTSSSAVTTITSSPHLNNRLDLVERALQAHQRLRSQSQSQSRGTTTIPTTEHEHDGYRIDGEEEERDDDLRQQYQYSSNHNHHGWVVIHPTAENDDDYDREEEEEEVADGTDEVSMSGRMDRDIDKDMDLEEHEEEEEDYSRQTQNKHDEDDYDDYEEEKEGEEHMSLGSGYSTEPEPELETEPELPRLSPYIAANKGGEGEEEGKDGSGDGDEAASGLLSLLRG